MCLLTHRPRGRVCVILTSVLAMLLLPPQSGRTRTTQSSECYEAFALSQTSDSDSLSLGFSGRNTNFVSAACKLYRSPSTHSFSPFSRLFTFSPTWRAKNAVRFVVEDSFTRGRTHGLRNVAWEWGGQSSVCCSGASALCTGDGGNLIMGIYNVDRYLEVRMRDRKSVV